MQDPVRSSHGKRFIIIGKHAFRLACVMTLVSLATFGALVETYKLLF
jgi:hypothetical protein